MIGDYGLLETTSLATTIPGGLLHDVPYVENTCDAHSIDIAASVVNEVEAPRENDCCRMSACSMANSSDIVWRQDHALQPTLCEEVLAE